MALKKEFVALLVCPVCKENLMYQETANSLICTPCGLVYSVHDDIPILIAEKAEKL